MQDHGFNNLVDTIRRLRAPDGCPWDREQTPQSSRKNLLEETYEVLHAINEDDDSGVREELGDLLMLIVMVARMYQEADSFSIADVINEIVDKLVRRHPHVFGDEVLSDSEEVVTRWNEIKRDVEGKAQDVGVLSGVGLGMPPLDRAARLQKSAAKVGFDWPDIQGVIGKLQEELVETQEESAGDDTAALELEIGDVLFSAVNVARFLGVDPSVALAQANAKFERRFRYIERKMAESGISPAAEHFSMMDTLWDESKSEEV